ncbi:MAG: pentapeptide repeat-containing protein [Candidatus Methanospirare jalkutatii]|nr:pentapeptide repeat-containing protein [Candidatus Methanospirare jalkutatii]
MAKCKFKSGAGRWECPLEAIPGEEYCYWHKEEEGKEPDDAKLRELKENEIWGVFLRKAKLSEKELQNAFLSFASLQGADLSDANLQGAFLSDANLQEAFLWGANLQEAVLSFANLQGAFLSDANLQGANLSLANLQGADLSFASLQGADLSDANLQGAVLLGADLEGANLFSVRVDSETRLDGANLTCANLYRSYLDETKTLRNAEFKSEKEINEIVADFLKRRNKELAVLDVEKIERDDSEVVAELFEEGLVRYVSVGEPIVFFDRKRRGVVRIPGNAENKFFQRLRKRRNSEEEKNYVEISELNDLIERKGFEKYLYKGSVKELYEASYEVYNKLYYFYIQNGRLEEALDMHYRRCEVRRKLLREQGWINRLRSWIYDFFILKLLTGYGVKISRPLIASAIIISIFAFLFWLTNGIVKNVNGKMVAPDFFDYIYHSVITFTSLGYSNIQPNLAVGHIPQVLAAVESVLGALMMALLIFTITYRVSR